ncbi:MAG: hypothetical protein ACK57Y_07995, partial [Pirellulaceae bacterium]
AVGSNLQGPKQGIESDGPLAQQHIAKLSRPTSNLLDLPQCRQLARSIHFVGVMIEPISG